MALGCIFPIAAPAVPVAVVYGNTLLWTIAALFTAAAATPGAAWTMAFKPTDMIFGVPFVLRSWRGLVVAFVLSAILLPLWIDWLEAMRNVEGWSPLRGVSSWPALCIPLMAWVAGRSGQATLRGWLLSQPTAVTSESRRVCAPSS